MVDWAVRLELDQVQSLQQVHNLVTSLGREAVVVRGWHMNSEFKGFAWGHRLTETANILDSNLAFDVFFVDIVDAEVGDNKGAFLGPLKHVGLLDLVCEEKFLSRDKLHKARVLLEPYKVLNLQGLQRDLGVGVHHSVSQLKLITTLISVLKSFFRYKFAR